MGLFNVDSQMFWAEVLSIIGFEYSMLRGYTPRQTGAKGGHDFGPFALSSTIEPLTSSYSNFQMSNCPDISILPFKLLSCSLLTTFVYKSLPIMTPHPTESQ